MFGYTLVPNMRGIGTLGNGGIKAMEELTKPHEGRIDPPRMGNCNNDRRNDDEYAQRVRPSKLQKRVKKYDGSKDPHDHIATFRQVLRPEQV